MTEQDYQALRAHDRKLHALMRQQVETILAETARQQGGTVEIRTTIDVMSVENSAELCGIFRSVMGQLFPERVCKKLPEPPMIGEDFARFAARVPGVHFRLCTRPQNSTYPLHHPKFDVDESVLHRGSLAFAAFALDWQETQTEQER